jgi:hypothetical protein
MACGTNITDLIGFLDPLHSAFKEGGFLTDVHRPYKSRLRDWLRHPYHWHIVALCQVNASALSPDNAECMPCPFWRSLGPHMMFRKRMDNGRVTLRDGKLHECDHVIPSRARDVQGQRHFPESWTVYDPLAATCLTAFTEKLVADLG